MNNSKILSDNEFVEEFATRLNSAMRNKNMSINELASETDVTARSIYRYINGKSTPNITTAYQMAKALDCDVSDLLPIDY